jgi:hypothetical protein
MLKGLRLAGIASLALVVVTMTASAAGASTATTAIATHHHKSRICTGTLKSPGVLAGTFRGDVRVIGVCNVNGGKAVIHGDLILTPGSVLNATFALNDVRKKGKSSLTVHGDVKVGAGATLAMGCEPKEQPCSDDPNAGTGGTLTGSNRVSGDIEAMSALAVLLHASKIRGDVIMIGGGGGVTCAIPTTGIFSVLKSPVFSDAEGRAAQSGARQRLHRLQQDGRPGRERGAGQRHPRQHRVLREHPGNAVRGLHELAQQGAGQGVRGMRVQREAAQPGAKRAAYTDLHQDLTRYSR